MTRARALADLANSGVFSPNAGLSRVGINSTSPSVTLDVGGGASFAGNVSVGGTLTYDDVTNIDSVGIITAQSGIHVTGGSVGIGTNNPVGNLEVRDSKANLIVAKDGLTVKANSAFHTSYDNVQLGAGGGLASYSTATATADTQFLHNAYRHSGGNWKYRYADTAARLRVNSPGRTWIFESAASGSADGDITFSEQLRITSNGDLMTGGITSGAGKVQVGGGLRIAGSATHTDTASPYLYRTSGADNLCIATNSVERLRITSGGLLRVPDNGKFTCGAGDDLQIYHDGSDSRIHNGTGTLVFRTGTNYVFYNSDGTEKHAQFLLNGEVELFYDGSKKFDTKSDGCEVIGELQCDSLDVDGAADITGNVTLHANLDLQDNDKILIGTGDDLEIYHDGSQSYIAGDDIRITNNAVSETIAKFLANGAVELNHNDSKKFETTSSGVTVTGNILPEANGTRDLGSSSYRFANLYTSDLDLSNEAKGGNEVDGTWGAYTIQEGEDDLFLLNRRNGKKYKFMLQEVN